MPRKKGKPSAAQERFQRQQKARAKSRSQTAARHVQKKRKLRSSARVLEQLQWDETTGIDTEDVVIGYSDHVKGPQEVGFKWFKPVSQGGDIPMHHVQYFRVGDVRVWDRETRLDRLKGSGETQPDQLWAALRAHAAAPAASDAPVAPDAAAAPRITDFFAVEGKAEDDEADEDDDAAVPPATAVVPRPAGAMGALRVLIGRSVRKGRAGWQHPARAGYEAVPVLSTYAKGWGQLSPFHLRDARDRIVENVWQFGKVYPSVPEQSQSKWKHPAEQHVGPDGELLPAYWAWRHKGMTHSHAVRRPVPRAHSRNCLFYLTDDGRRLNYVEARQQVYVQAYVEALRAHPKFAELVRLASARPIIITEVDGPHQESAAYYRSKYGVDVVDGGGLMRPTPERLRVMLLDEKHPFGHGYCVAMALLGLDVADLLAAGPSD